MAASSPTQIASRIAEGLDALVELDAPLAGLTWFGVGGRADILVRPKTEHALKELLRRCHGDQVTVRVLGSGANLLVLDEGVDGVVIKLDQPAFTRWTLRPDGESNMVHAPAGVDLFKLLNECVREGLDGLCHMAGIPASMGGATRMNAGGKFGSISDAIHSVATMDQRGEIVVHPVSGIPFSYRHSGLPDDLILWTRLRMTPGDPAELRKRTLEINQYKKRTQPMAQHSAGCLFRNPLSKDGTRTSAGRLIDLAGMKGFTHGSAFVSQEHANFVCAKPGGRANDVLELAGIIQERVLQSQGMAIEMEAIVWGRSLRTLKRGERISTGANP